MDQSEELSELISGIYDAALDASLWKEVVGKAGRFVGGPAAAIFSKSPVAANGNLHCEYGTDPYYRQLYFRQISGTRPCHDRPIFRRYRAADRHIGSDAIQRFLETQFYKEWAQPQGLVDFVSAVLDKSVNNAAMFGVFR